MLQTIIVHLMARIPYNNYTDTLGAVTYNFFFIKAIFVIVVLNKINHQFNIQHESCLLYS